MTTNQYYLANREKHDAATKLWKQNNKRKVAGYSIKERAEYRERYLFRIAKHRAKKKGIPFTIEVTDIVIPDVCPFFNEPFVFEFVGSPHPFAASLDRIEPELGYVKGNIQVVSNLANKMKWTATNKQLVMFANGILELEKRRVNNAS